MKRIYLLLILLVTVFAQAEQMWHVKGTNHYARQQCLKQIDIVEDSLTGAPYYFRNIPFNKELRTSDFETLYDNVFNRLVQTGSVMPVGYGDIGDIDEGMTGFYRMLWDLEEFPSDEGWWIWPDVGIPDIARCNWTDINPLVGGCYMRLLYNLTLQNFYLQASESLNQYSAERAQVRFVRALTAWYLLDLFSASHFTTEPKIDGNAVISRQALYGWLENELTELVSLLPATRTDIYHVDADAAKLLLARLYLNAEVYTGTAQWSNASQYAEQVMKGNHPLHTQSKGIYSAYQELFMGDNDSNGAAEEMLLTIKQDGKSAYGYGGSIYPILITRTDDGSMPSCCMGVQGWKCWRSGYRLLEAFATTSQLSSVRGTEFTIPATLGDDRALFYADNSYSTPSLSGNFDGDYFTLTWSVNKFTNRYSTDPLDGSACSASSGEWADTDLPLMRSAEAYLTYAEAQFRLGNTTMARNTIATLRSRAHAATPDAISLDYILDEWMREFHQEGRRRTDLVRFGQFAGAGATRTWEGHSAITDASRNTYPVLDLLARYPRFDNLTRFYAYFRNINYNNPSAWAKCDSCNTGEVYRDEIGNEYSINYNHYGGGIFTGYEISKGGEVELELAEFPYMKNENKPATLPEVEEQQDAFTIMLYSETDCSNNLIVQGNYLNAAGEWVYHGYRPTSHPVAEDYNSQNFARFQPIGDGWYKAVIYPITEKDDSYTALQPGYAEVRAIAYKPENNTLSFVQTGIHKAGGVPYFYAEGVEGMRQLEFSQIAYYEHEQYGKIYSSSQNSDRVVYLYADSIQIPDIPEVAAVEGAYTIVIKFDGEVCNDIVVPGSYKSDENGWITALNQIQKMEPIEGFDGWYKVVIPWEEDYLYIKPVQLTIDGKFSWDNQTGNVNSWIVLAGSNYVSIEDGYADEADLTFTGKGQVVVLESKSWKTGANICKTPDLYDVVVTVRTPAIPADKKVYLTGEFDNWTGAGLELTPNAARTEWTGTLKQVELNTMIKATLGSWDDDSMKYNEEKACWEGANGQIINNIKYYFEVDNFKSMLEASQICEW